MALKILNIFEHMLKLDNDKIFSTEILFYKSLLTMIINKDF